MTNVIAFVAAKTATITIVQLVTNTGMIIDCFGAPHSKAEQWAKSPKKKEYLESIYGHLYIEWSWTPWKVQDFTWFKENYKAIWDVSYDAYADRDPDGVGARATY